MEAGRGLCSHTWFLSRCQVSLSLGQRMFFAWLWRRWGGELVGVKAGVRVEGSEDVKGNFRLVNLRVSVTSSDFCTHTENQLKSQSATLPSVRASCFANKGPRHVRRGNLLDAGRGRGTAGRGRCTGGGSAAEIGSRSPGSQAHLPPSGSTRWKSQSRVSQLGARERLGQRKVAGSQVHQELEGAEWTRTGSSARNGKEGPPRKHFRNWGWVGEPPDEVLPCPVNQT